MEQKTAGTFSEETVTETFAQTENSGNESAEFGISEASDDSSVSQIDNSNKININTADSAALQTLSGIGEARAEAIINYRNENGKFIEIEDIMNVKGIGEGIFSSIKDNITIE